MIFCCIANLAFVCSELPSAEQLKNRRARLDVVAHLLGARSLRSRAALLL